MGPIGTGHHNHMDRSLIDAPRYESDLSYAKIRKLAHFIDLFHLELKVAFRQRTWYVWYAINLLSLVVLYIIRNYGSRNKNVDTKVLL